MDRVGPICVAAIATLIFLKLLAESGALPWVILGGLLSGGCALLLLRNWHASASVGAVIALVISVIGIGRMFT